MGYGKALSKLSFREMVLVVIFLTLLLLYISYTFILEPTKNEYELVNEQYEMALKKNENLKKDMEKMEDYINERDLLITEIDAFEEELPDRINQEKVLFDLFLDEDNSQVVINNYSFNTLELLPLADYQRLHSEDKEQTIDLTQYNEAYVLEYDLIVNLKGDYEQVYDFINALENHEEHIRINTVSIVSSEGEIVCSLNITYIGFLNSIEANALNNTLENTIDRESIFTQSDFKGNTGTEKSYNIYNPDFSLLINTYLENGPKYTLSKSGDSTSEIYVDGNRVVNASIVISEEDNKFKYAYEFGETTYSGEFTELRCEDETIYINVVSQERVDNEDQTGVLLTLKNDTNHLVQLTVINDDEKHPRFRLADSSGRVIIENDCK